MSTELARRDDWSHGIRLYAPLSTPRPVAADVWIVDGPVIQMRVGLVALPLPTRMVIVRLPDGGLWLWSPTAPTPALFAAVDAIGPVAHLVSPNKLHYAGIPAWQARYPDAIAQLKKDLKEGRVQIEAILLDPPEYVSTAKVFDMLMALPKFGRVKAARLLNQCRISQSKTVGGMSERQRAELVSLFNR